MTKVAPPPTSAPGFGDFEGKNISKSLATLKKVQKVALAALGVSLIGAAIASVYFAPLTLFFAGTALFAGLSLLYVLKEVKSLKGLKTKPDGEEILKPGVSTHKTVQATIIKSGKEANMKRLDLIKEAKHQVVFSGNYCGGKIFQEILEEIEKKLEEIPEFQALILSSPEFIKPDNKKTIEALYQKFPDRFAFVNTPVTLVKGPNTKRATNHTKAFVIDYGKKFLVGSDGIEDRYTRDEGEVSRSRSRDQKEKENLLEKMLPKAFFDNAVYGFDTADEHNLGAALYFQLIHLAQRWKGLRKQPFYSPSFKLRSAPLSPMPKDVENPKAFRAKFLANAPEHRESATCKELIEAISKAEKEIFIAHNYFHPNSDVINALAEAIDKRQVKVTILTSGHRRKNTPPGQRIYADNNRLGYYFLHRKVKNKENISYHEFVEPDMTYHKKVVVTDRHVMMGNGNLGYKSMTRPTDYELNLLFESKRFARKFKKVIAEDLQIAEKVPYEALKINWVKGAGYFAIRSLVD